jgi:hypothetical protein
LNMKFIHTNSSIGEIPFPNDLRKWVSNYNKQLAPAFYLDLTEEMPCELLGYISCMINQEENLALLKCTESQYVNVEGNSGHVIRDVNNIFTEETEIYFETFEGMKQGWAFSKYLLLEMNKAISVIEFLVEHHAYPNDVRIDRYRDLEK